MSGNASEEGVMMQLDNPSHTDVGRVAVPVGILTIAMVYFSLRVFLPWLMLLPSALVAIAVGCAVGMACYRRLTQARITHAAERMSAQRQAHDQETERQLAEMKKRI